MVVDGDYLRFTLDAPNGQAVSPHLVLDALLEGRHSEWTRHISIHKTGFATNTAAQR